MYLLATINPMPMSVPVVSLVLQVDPEMRVRFTSPHPKDFPDEVSLVPSPQPHNISSSHSLHYYIAVYWDTGGSEGFPSSKSL